MTINQNKKATQNVAKLTKDEKADFMIKLAQIDNLGTLSEENLEKINGGNIPYIILGIFFNIN